MNYHASRIRRQDKTVALFAVIHKVMCNSEPSKKKKKNKCHAKLLTAIGPVY